MENNETTVAVTAIVAALFFLLMVQSCVKAVNRECEQTRRDALASSEPARSLVLTKSCRG